MRARTTLSEDWERLADALVADLLEAGAAEVLDSHPGAAARVRADAIRQALRRGAAEAPPDDGLPRDLLQVLATRAQRENGR